MSGCKIFKNQLVGAINSYIRTINESDKWNPEGLAIIGNEWQSTISQNGTTFIATLKINGKEENIIFQKEEWQSYKINIFANKQLRDLLKRCSNSTSIT